jgi:hypothetical protein
MKKTGWMILAAMALSPLGCAHQEIEKRVDYKVSQENDIKTHADLNQETDRLILSDPALTDNQRKQLLRLRSETWAKLEGLLSESLKLRSVLIKDLLARNYDPDEVDLIKNRLKDLEQERTATTLGSVEAANTILGHDRLLAQNRRRIMEDFFEWHGLRENI